MIRRFFVLLIATVALVSGVYALRSRKAEKRAVVASSTSANPIALSATELTAPPSFAHDEVASSPRENAVAGASTIRPRLAALVVLAAVLSAGAHFGLGNGSELVQAAQILDPSPSPAASTLVASHSPPPLSGSVRALFSGDGLPPPAAPTPPPATPEPTPAVAAVVATPRPAPPIPADGIEGIICALPWPCQEAIAVAACESGRDRYGRLDGSSDTNGNHYGVFQISGIHAWRWPDFWENWMDPAKNAQWAYEIWAEQGWKPWSCRWAAYS
jgi:hypothetical protein